MTKEYTADKMREQVDTIYRTESRRIFATLIRLLGDFDLAEDALHETFRAAMEQWPRDGIPANPRAWLVSTGHFKAIDAQRRRARFDTSLDEVAERLDHDVEAAVLQSDEDIVDDRLRLIFTCCHPALPAEAIKPMSDQTLLPTDKVAKISSTASHLSVSAETSLKQ